MFIGLRFKLVVGLIIVLISGLLLAHGGATGIVKERMESMKEMKSSMKSLTEMFRGKKAYVAGDVTAAAQVIFSTAGDELTRLFPEGSLHKPSEAKPEIWHDWERFQTLAEQLKTYSAALAEGAERRMPRQNNERHSKMNTADMMGTTMMGMGASMEPDQAMLEKMPADGVFKLLADTCSSCHKRFRIETEDKQ